MKEDLLGGVTRLVIVNFAKIEILFGFIFLALGISDGELLKRGGNFGLNFDLGSEVADS